MQKHELVELSQYSPTGQSVSMRAGEDFESIDVALPRQSLAGEDGDQRDICDEPEAARSEYDDYGLVPFMEDPDDEDDDLSDPEGKDGSEAPEEVSPPAAGAAQDSTGDSAGPTPPPGRDRGRVQSASTDRSSMGERKLASAHAHEYSTTKAAFHIFKGNVGAAIFSLSDAYDKAGFVAGTGIILFFAIVCVHCMLLLVECKQTLNNPHVQTYGQVANAAFGRRGKHVVDIFIVVTQLGFCCTYYQFASGMLHNVVGPVSVTAWILIMVPVATGLTFLPNMKKLVPAAIFATMATLFSLVVVYGYAVQEVVQTPALDRQVVAFTSPWKWPIAMGNAISAFEGIGLVLPIENGIRDKTKFPRLITLTFVIISALYISFGVAGYVAYATPLEASGGSVTDVIPSNWLTGLVRLGMAVAILLTFPIQFFPAIQVIEGWLLPRPYRYQVRLATSSLATGFTRKIAPVCRPLNLC
ncbi:Amino acid transporter ANTL1 [Diplonema papillatum]|nr:Amino acid transporter ANTL1 [Diplonema papillatum]